MVYVNIGLFVKWFLLNLTGYKLQWSVIQIILQFSLAEEDCSYKNKAMQKQLGTNYWGIMAQLVER